LKQSTPPITPAPLATGLLALALSACQATPPAAFHEGDGALVRADDVLRAREVAQLFDQLHPLVTEQLPDSNCRAREVWIQSQPQLYLFSGATYQEADGFWSENHGRIHLRNDAQSLARTLAHELVHSSLGPSWEVLPGTIEEGLCDVVSVLLCPDNSTGMRTGRLSAAAFATGGLELEIELFLPAEAGAGKVQIGCMTRMRLQGEVSPDFDPQDVFTIPAGLSTTDLPVNDKKALYGLSYLLVDRIVARVGFEGLHDLCLEAARQGLAEIPAPWLMEAGGMESSGAGKTWRTALRAAFGPEELQTLVNLYPELLEDSAGRVFGPRAAVYVTHTDRSTVAASVRVTGTDSTLDLRLEVRQEAFARADSPRFQE
jgi:hypothetical protein